MNDKPLTPEDLTNLRVCGLSIAQISALKNLFYRMWGTDPAKLTPSQISAGGPGRPTAGDFARTLDRITSENARQFDPKPREEP